MGCDCHSLQKVGAIDPVTGWPIDPVTGRPKKPCTPCQQAADAIVRAGLGHVGVGATDDLTAIQAFLQSLTNGVSPTPAALSDAQAAASRLSVELQDMTTRQANMQANMGGKNTAILSGVGGAVLGAAIALVAKGGR